MYRTIACEFWTDDKVRALSADETLLFLYLITNPHSHYSGLYYLSLVTMRDESKLRRGFDGAWKGLRRELIAYDERLQHVWVRNMFEHQGSGHKLEKGVANHLKTLHRSMLIPLFLQRYPNIAQYCDDTLLIPYPYPTDRGAQVPSPDPVQDPDVLISSPKHLKSKPLARQEGFERFWSLYPKKIGKGAAEKAWSHLHHENGLVERICTQVKAASLTDQWMKDAGKYIPHPATWLNQSRWEDTYEPGNAPQSTHSGFASKDYRAGTW